MHDGSWLLGHVRLHNKDAISHKVEKEGKPYRKNPPPKREMKDVWMDGLIKTPPLRHTLGIYNKEI